MSGRSSKYRPSLSSNYSLSRSRRHTLSCEATGWSGRPAPTATVSIRGCRIGRTRVASRDWFALFSATIQSGVETPSKRKVEVPSIGRLDSREHTGTVAHHGNVQLRELRDAVPKVRRAGPGFQTKDGDLNLDLVEIEAVVIMYSRCECGHWIELSRAPPPLTP